MSLLIPTLRPHLKRLLTYLPTQFNKHPILLNLMILLSTTPPRMCQAQYKFCLFSHSNLRLLMNQCINLNLGNLRIHLFIRKAYQTLPKLAFMINKLLQLDLMRQFTMGNPVSDSCLDMSIINNVNYDIIKEILIS